MIEIRRVQVDGSEPLCTGAWESCPGNGFFIDARRGSFKVCIASTFDVFGGVTAHQRSAEFVFHITLAAAHILKTTISGEVRSLRSLRRV